MSSPFDPNAGAVTVLGELAGPAGTIALRLLVDTGADVSVIDPVRMLAAGYDPAQPLGQISVTTAHSAGSAVGFFRVTRLTALGVDRLGHIVLSYALPPNVGFDGLLGLDFFEDRVLTIDFVRHTVSLT